MLLNRSPSAQTEGQPRAFADFAIDDAELLIELVRKHDPEAFSVIYERFRPLVFATAAQMLRDHQGAEDVTQSVFMGFWISPGSIVGGNLGGWFSRMARNRALDVIRRRHRCREDGFTADVRSDAHIENHVLAKFDADEAREALAQLPPHQREPIELGFFGGVTHAALARCLAIPLGTVKTRIRSGLENLRSTLEATPAFRDEPAARLGLSRVRATAGQQPPRNCPIPERLQDHDSA
jgi:RNA polymerase sigma-70 factor (ECF subfamily)